jgi:site-specific recombinase XerD
MKQAGVEGGGGFHQLRQAQGKNLVVSGVPVTTVSQVLGHTDISNTKQYIALDTRSLKVCALDFAGIRPRGWNE